MDGLKIKNYALIDGQNLNLGVRNDVWRKINENWYQRLYKGWPLDYKKFRIYLKDKYNIEKAYYFIGELKTNTLLYKNLQEYGYIVIFKPAFRGPDGKVKGNVDAELVLQAMIDFKDYDKALIVAGDGDYACLVKYLIQQNKLAQVLAPNYESSSWLLREAAGNEYIAFMNTLKDKLEFIPDIKKGFHKDKTLQEPSLS